MKDRLIAALRWSERYTKTDMVYLASGGFWLSLGQIGAILLSLATAIAFGHLAQPDLYGNYKYILSLAGLFASLSLSGVATAIVQSTAKGYEGSLVQGTLLSLRWSWPSVALSLAAALYYGIFDHNFFLAGALAVAGLLSPFISSFSLFAYFFTGKKQFARGTAYSFLNALVPTLAIIGTLFFTNRAIFIILAYFVANAVADVVFWIITVREVKDAAQDPGLASYGKHLSLMNIISAAASYIDSVAVFLLLGPAALGVYAYASAMPEQIKGVVKNLGSLAFPQFARRSLPEIKKTIWQRLGVLEAAIAVAVLAYVALAPLIFHYLFPIYISSVRYSQLYALSILTSFITPIASVFQAHKKTRELYIFNNVPPILLLILLPTLTYLYGILGAVLSQIIYRTATAGLAVILLQRVED